MTNLKQCNKCGKTKHLSEFYKSGSNKGGISTICKVCMAKYTKAYYKKTREEYQRMLKEWHPEMFGE